MDYNVIQPNWFKIPRESSPLSHLIRILESFLSLQVHGFSCAEWELNILSISFSIILILILKITKL